MLIQKMCRILLNRSIIRCFVIVLIIKITISLTEEVHIVHKRLGRLHGATSCGRCRVAECTEGGALAQSLPIVITGYSGDCERQSAISYTSSQTSLLSAFREIKAASQLKRFNPVILTFMILNALRRIVRANLLHNS